MAQCFCEGSSEMLYRRLHSARRTAKDTLLTEYGLQNLGQPMLLSILRQKPDGTADSQRELADDLRIERATVTVTLQKLERGGFIRREADPDDQRVMRIYPTEKGINAVNNITVEIQRFHEACAKSLTDEQRQLLELLQKLENTVVDYLQGLNRPD